MRWLMSVGFAVLFCALVVVAPGPAGAAPCLQTQQSCGNRCTQLRDLIEQNRCVNRCNDAYLRCQDQCNR